MATNGCSGRFSLEDAYKQPFRLEPMFRLSLPPNVPYATKKLPPDSDEYSAICHYLQQTCDRDINRILPDSVAIYQYRRYRDQNLTRYQNANWLLWTGVRAECLDSIKWEGLQLPNWPKRALFFTPSFASALKYTDLQWAGCQKAGDPERLVPYRNRVLYVLLCEVALGNPYFVKSRYFESDIRFLDRKEASERRFWQCGDPGGYQRSFPVTRYQRLKSKFVDRDFLGVDDVVDKAKAFQRHSVVTGNATLVPSDATVWKGMYKCKHL